MKCGCVGCGKLATIVRVGCCRACLSDRGMIGARDVPKPRADVAARRFKAGHDVEEIARLHLVAYGWTYDSPTWRSDLAAMALEVQGALRRATNRRTR